MTGSKKIGVVMVICATVVALGIFLIRQKSSIVQGQPRAVAVATAPVTNHLHIHTVARTSSGSGATEETNEDQSEARLREKVEEYLIQHHRDLASLLTAFHELNDTNYLVEAATSFPNDPRLQWTVIMHNVFPEEQRKWLDSFKASSPSNSLANYLSAQDYFKNGLTNEAFQELVAASTKPQFADYSADSVVDSEALGRFMGRSGLEKYDGAMTAMSRDIMPELKRFSGIVSSIHGMLQQYAASGDGAAVQDLAQIGTGFADRLISGEGEIFTVDQAVGITFEKTVMQALDQNTSYDFLGGETPAQRLAKLDRHQADIREATKNFLETMANARQDQLDEYWERMKIYGELNALKWLKEQEKAGPPGN